jgi:uncharacterized integral membrane protein (TIGR00698 family)
VIDAEDSDVSFAVATVTVLGLIAMFLLPVLGHAAHMSDRAFGIWAGLSIHQTPQVVASGMSYSPAAGDSATIVKLARVSLLAPVVAGIGMLYARKRSVGESLSAASLVKLFPIFILGFLMMALVRTLGWLPKPVIDWCDLISRFLITCAMAAVGLETTLKSLRNTGLRPFVLGALASVVICLLIVAALKVTSVAT